MNWTNFVGHQNQMDLPLSKHIAFSNAKHVYIVKIFLIFNVRRVSKENSTTRSSVVALVCLMLYYDGKEAPANTAVILH